MTKYNGTFEGLRYESLYPNLYRVTYWATTNRNPPHEYTVIRSGMSPRHAIEPILKMSNLTRHPVVELVHTLEAVR